MTHGTFGCTIHQVTSHPTVIYLHTRIAWESWRWVRFRFGRWGWGWSCRWKWKWYAMLLVAVVSVPFSVHYFSLAYILLFLSLLPLLLCTLATLFSVISWPAQLCASLWSFAGPPTGICNCNCSRIVLSPSPARILSSRFVYCFLRLLFNRKKARQAIVIKSIVGNVYSLQRYWQGKAFSI